LSSEAGWQQWLDKLSLRERFILLIAALLVCYGLWHLVWFSGASTQRAAVVVQQGAIETQMTGLTQEMELLRRVLSGAVGNEKQRQLTVLETRIEQLDSDLARLAQGLVPAADLSLVLRDLLTQTEGLTLHQLQTQAVQRLRMDEASDESASVYRHPVSLVFAGDYFSVLEFITRLESLDWRLYFDHLHYRVKHYPRAQVTLGAYTLSAERGNLSAEP